MRQRRKRRKGKKIVVLLVVAVIILLAAGVLFLTFRQINQLKTEVTKISQMDVDAGIIDEVIYTEGSYAEVEQTIKEYVGTYVENLRTIRTIFQDQEFPELLSVENIQKDGPAFKNTLKYLEEKQKTADEAFQLLEEMAKEDSIMAAIEERGLNGYFEKMYGELMLGTVQTEFMYSSEELQAAQESIEETIAERKAAVSFLSEHSAEWKMKNEKLEFDSDELLNQYNELVSVYSE